MQVAGEKGQPSPGILCGPSPRAPEIVCRRAVRRLDELVE
jgi:hypothetical protein